jgi:hypothetical protein
LWAKLWNPHYGKRRNFKRSDHDLLWISASFQGEGSVLPAHPILLVKRATMRKLMLLCGALICGLLSAQNWALINPDYKYNYSLGGTDTITNQVFVAAIDTLGPDDRLLTLNRVPLVCDTCGADVWEVAVWPDAPQWLGGTVRVVADEWHFTGNGSQVILPLATDGSFWLYDTLNTIWAQMGPVVDITTFGLPDQHRAITLDNGEAIVISRDHGILSWSSGHTLIGINGPQVGRTIPTLQEFFPYEANDVLEYETWYGGCDGIGGCEGRSREFKFTVGESIETDSAILFSGWMSAHHLWYFQLGGIGSPTQYVHDYTNAAGEWIAGPPELPWSELLASYPGQLVQRLHQMAPNAGPDFCIAEHALDANGRYTIGCRAFERNEEVGYFFFSNMEAGPAGTILLNGPEDWCYPDGGDVCGVSYVEGVGMTGFNGNYFERGEHYLLRGLILGGDTVLGSITDDSILLNVSDLTASSGFTIAPNPVVDRISVNGLTAATEVLLLHDASGRLLRSLPVSSTSSEDLDVRDLASGIYLLRTMPGNEAKRFVVAR